MIAHQILNFFYTPALLQPHFNTPLNFSLRFSKIDHKIYIGLNQILENST